MERLFREHHGVLFVTAKMLLKDDEESRDVVSEVFADVLYGGIVLLPGSERGYLKACVRNKSLNILRHKRLAERVHRLMPVETEAGDGPEEHTEGELNAVMDYIDNGLTPQTSRVIKMRYEDRKTYREISGELGISTAAVYKHIAQAMRKLKEQFNKGNRYGEV